MTTNTKSLEIVYGKAGTGKTFTVLLPLMRELQRCLQRRAFDNVLRSAFHSITHGSQLRVLTACLLAREKGQSYIDFGSNRVFTTAADLSAFLDKLATDRQAQVDVYNHMRPTERGEELLKAWLARAGQ